MVLVFSLTNLQVYAQNENEYNMYNKIFDKISAEIERIKSSKINPSIQITLQKSNRTIHDYIETYIVICGDFFANCENFNRYDVSVFIRAMQKFVAINHARIFIFSDSVEHHTIARNLCDEKTRDAISFKPVLSDTLYFGTIANIMDIKSFENSPRVNILFCAASTANAANATSAACAKSATILKNVIILHPSHRQFCNLSNEGVCDASKLDRRINYFDLDNLPTIYDFDYRVPDMPINLRLTFAKNKCCDGAKCIVESMCNAKMNVKYAYIYFFECEEDFIKNILDLFANIGAKVEYRNNDNIVKYFNQEKQQINSRIGITQSADSIFSDALPKHEIINKIEVLVNKYLDDNEPEINPIIRANVIAANRKMLNNIQDARECSRERSRFDLNAITFTNFLSFNSTETMRFEEGLIAIRGNNGVGKSAIIDAIMLCIYMNKITKDNLSNYVNVYESSFAVDAAITKSNMEINVKRRRGQQCEDIMVFRNNDCEDIAMVAFNELNNTRTSQNNLTISGAVNINKALANLCGSHEVAVYSCLCLQRDENDFYKLAPNNQRKLLEQIFGIEFLNEIKPESKPRSVNPPEKSSVECEVIIAKIAGNCEILDARYKEYESEMAQCEESIEHARATLASKQLLDTLMRKYELGPTFDPADVERLRSINYVDNLRRKIKPVDRVNEQIIMDYLKIDSVKKLNKPTVIAQILSERECEFKDIASTIDEVVKYKQLIKTVDKGSAEYRIYRESLNNLRDEADKIMRYKQWMDAKVEIDKLHILRRNELIQYKIDEFEHAKQSGFLELFYEELAQMETLGKSIEDAQRIYDREILRRTQIRSNIKRIEEGKEKMRRAQIEVQNNLDTANAYERSLYADTIENENIRVLSRCYSGKDNIKLRILSHKLLTFNQIINSILLELRADLEVNIGIAECKFKSNGFVKSINLASGHQYNMINLATRIAIWKIYDGILPNFFIFDEAFVYSTRENLENVYNYLANKFKEPQFILVVSNNSIIDRFASEIHYCYSSDGKSRIDRSYEGENLPDSQCVDKSAPEYLAIVNVNKLPDYIVDSGEGLLICELCSTTIKSKSFVRRHINSKTHKRILQKKI